MKKAIFGLRVGQTIKVRVEELLPANDVLICFEGDLLIVHNETRRPLKHGDEVVLAVTAISPLRFQLRADRAEQRSRGRIDVSI